MRVVAIIQARMGSTRLPSKVLKPLAGHPMLWHVLTRVGQAKTVDQIIVATTDLERDTPICDLCEKMNVSYYRGSEEDVLDRFYQAGNKFDADVIVRLTGDCPLSDPQVIDQVVTSYLDNQDQYAGACNTVNRTFPRGVDVQVLSFKALEECWQQATESYHREHVFPWIYEHADKYPMKKVDFKKDISFYRLTVDEPEDFQLVEKIYQNLYLDNHIPLLDEIVDLLERQTDLIDINKHIDQKPVV